MEPIDGVINSLEQSKREQLLKLVTKGFFNELINYGVDSHEVVMISTNLLDELIQHRNCNSRDLSYSSSFKISQVQDTWKEKYSLSLGRVVIKPFNRDSIDLLIHWLGDPLINKTMIALLPRNKQQLKEYFADQSRFYFSVSFEDSLVGIIGGEDINVEFLKLGMRKFIGDRRMRGQGIGKSATFLFLYYCFIIKQYNKVFLNTCDKNIRNLNLNSRMGFTLEGILNEEIKLDNKKVDIVRMGLLRSVWLDTFQSF